jgi:glycosyltransferase involved in cell wall biosynthesis
MNKKLEIPQNPPLITIGVTAFNAETTIESAIRSAVGQTWPNFEIVCVDDCSNDNTLQILADLEKKHPNMRVYKNDHNGGEPVTRNHILQEAKGEFIAFFDDDDESAPERLTRQYQRIVDYEHDFAQGQPVICHTARLQRYNDSSELYEATMGTAQGELAPHGRAVAERILLGRPLEEGVGSMATCSQMARREVYQELGLYDERMRRMPDTDLNIRLALAGGHFVGIAEPLVTQTMTLTTDKYLSEERSYNLKYITLHKSFLEKTGSYDFCWRWIDAKYDLLEGKQIKFMVKLSKLFICYPVATLRRLYWSIPGVRNNLQLRKFHNSRK